MFAPDERAVLREALRPEVGESLVHAVGTTFSLDLSAALAVPLAFAAQSLSDSADPIAVLEAVRSASDRVDVFCQCGSIRAPRAPSDLVAFLEPMLHEVRAPQHEKGYLFHPKVWVARYDADGEDRFRLICSTRNLTESASWDAVVRLDGRPYGRRTDTQNRPVMELLRALPAMSVRQMEAGRQTRIEELAEAIGPVVWEPPAGLGSPSLTFHSLGLRRIRGLPPIIDSLRGRRHLIVSPFLDDAGLEAITESSADVTVVSRAEDLDRLSPETVSGLECRIISPLAGLTSVDEDEPAASDVQGVLGGLHAKMYVVEAANQAALLLGSANATSAGLFGHNVEFMVEFRGGRRALGIDNFLSTDTGLGKLLEEYPAEGGQQRSTVDECQRLLDRRLRAVAGTNFVATVTCDADIYAQEVKADAEIPAHEDGVELKLSLYGHTGHAFSMTRGQGSWVFNGLGIAEISAFLVITASIGDGASRVERSTLVRSELIGDPGTHRDEILAKQFATAEQFLRFLALLLGIDQSFVVAGGESSGSTVWRSLGTGSGLFELLVNAVAARPKALDDLARLVERLQQTDRGRAVLPEGFEQLWTAVVAARQRIGDRT